MSSSTAIRTIDVRKQHVMSFRETWHLCIQGVKHRLFRSALTLAVVVLAVAFFMFLLSESMFERSVARGVTAEDAAARASQVALTKMLSPASDAISVERLAALHAGAGSGAERFETGRDLLDHGFSAYRSIRVSAAGEGFGSIPVKGSLVRQIGAEAGDDTFLLISTVKKEYTLEPALAELLEAPIKRGDAVGMLTVRGADGEVLAETVLVSDRDAPESGFLDCARLIMRRFIGLETEEGGEE